MQREMGGDTVVQNRKGKNEFVNQVKYDNSYRSKDCRFI